MAQTTTPPHHSRNRKPWLVLRDFFSIYHLTGIRRILDLLLETSVIAEEEDTKSFFFDIKNLHRLTEAAWLLHLQKKEYQQKENGSSTMEQSEEDQSREGSNKPFFQKQFRLMDNVAHQPMPSLHLVFRSTATKQLKNILSSWLGSAVTSGAEPYFTATERAGLMAFCIRLKYLVEAGYVINLTSQLREQKGIDVNTYSGLSTDLFLKEGVEDLNEEEIQEPYTVVKDFFSRFPLLHSRAELWDLFSAALKTIENKNDMSLALVTYQQLYTLIEALYRLQKQQAQTPEF